MVLMGGSKTQPRSIYSWTIGRCFCKIENVYLVQNLRQKEIARTGNYCKRPFHNNEGAYEYALIYVDMVNSDDSYEQQDQQLVRQAKYLEHKVETIIDDWREFGNIEAIKDDLNLVVITTHAAIEDATAHLITRHVIDDKFSDEAHDYVYSNMSQSHREQLLVSCGILSDSTRGKLGQFRGIRNAVAHEPFARLDWEEENVGKKLREATTALEHLTDATVDDGWMNEIIQRDEEKI